jgi:hypothetical protein
LNAFIPMPTIAIMLPWTGSSNGVASPYRTGESNKSIISADRENGN